MSGEARRLRVVAEVLEQPGTIVVLDGNDQPARVPVNWVTWVDWPWGAPPRAVDRVILSDMLPCTSTRGGRVVLVVDRVEWTGEGPTVHGWVRVG